MRRTCEKELTEGQGSDVFHSPILRPAIVTRSAFLTAAYDRSDHPGSTRAIDAMCVMPVGMGSTRGQVNQGAGQHHEAVGSPPVSPPGFAVRGDP